MIQCPTHKQYLPYTVQKGYLLGKVCKSTYEMLQLLCGKENTQKGGIPDKRSRDQMMRDRMMFTHTELQQCTSDKN